MTQEERVIEYINANGSITSLEAFRKLGITRLSSVIFKLRRKGLNITTENERGKNRFGDKTNYGRYFIEE